MARVEWQGNATDIPQITTLTVTGTWAATETITITSHRADIVITVGTDIAVADIAEIIRRAINGDALKNDESRTATGDEIGGLVDVTATNSAGVVTITGLDGIPFNISQSETSALGSIATATSQAATGKWFQDNGDNWSTGTMPGVSDVAVVKDGNVDIRYNIADADVDCDEWEIYDTYTGRIGLRDINIDNPELPYGETETTHLEIGDATARLWLRSTGGGEGSDRIRIDFTNASANVNLDIEFAGPREQTDIPSCEIDGFNHASCDVNITRGDVKLSGTLIGTLHQGHTGNPAGDTFVEIDVATVTTYNMSGGVTFSRCTTVTTLTQYAGEFTQEDDGTTSTVVTTANVYGGTLFYNATSSLSGFNLGGTGIIDMSRTHKNKTAITGDMFGRDCLLKDPNYTCDSAGMAIDFQQGALPSQVEWGSHIRLTRADIS